MKKRFIKGIAVMALIAGLAVMSFAAQIFLKNGRVIQGEIVSYNAASVTIKDSSLGTITIARENILKIEPPLDETKPAAAAQAPVEQAQPSTQQRKITLENGRVLEGEVVSYSAKGVTIKDSSLGTITIARENILKIEPPLDETKPAAATQAPRQQPQVSYERQDYQPTKSGGIQLGFSLSGGMSNIDGGDFNAFIRDQNLYVADYNAYTNTNYYTIDWKEMKWLTNFKGEVFVRFAKYFGVGLGVEYMKKSNPGTMVYKYSYAHTYTYSSYYNNYTYTHDATWKYDQSMTIIPLTLNLYGYLPIGNIGEAYINVGPGLYLGTHETTVTLDETAESKNTYYRTNGTAWPPNYNDKDVYADTSQYKATCNAIGFHFGAGFNFNLTSSIAVFGEGYYRMAKFNDWQGDASYDNTTTSTWGWTDDTPSTSTSHSSDSYTGKVWYYDYYNSNLKNKSYATYDLYETNDEPTESSSVKNVRPAEFNINGISFRAGIKFSFNL